MIDLKRAELEEFIRQQTLGPGIEGLRFHDLNDAADILQGQPLDREIIDTNPAGIYSTGILFPVDDTRGGIEQAPMAETQLEPQPPTPTQAIEDEDSAGDDEEDPLDQQQLNQMYPNSIGLTVCLHRDVLSDKDLRITIYGRYYTKLDLTKGTERIGVLLECDRKGFEAWLQSLPEQDVIRNNVEVTASGDGKDYIFLSNGAASFVGMKKRYYDIKNEYAERLRTEIGASHRSLDGIKESLFGQLQSKIDPNSDDGKALAATLSSIETFENMMSHVLDLINVHDPKGHGAWRAEPFERTVPHLLSDQTKTKLIYTYHGKPYELNDIVRIDYATDKWASLSANLQYTRYTKKDPEKIFLKVQLVNRSKTFDQSDTRNGKSYFSLANDEVNKRSFFGAGIKVESKHLLPYRDLTVKDGPDHSEEAINSYIYRQYKDYGQGHGCSVKWNIEEEGARTVSTEYIPGFETPDVDTVPRDRNSFDRAPDGTFFPTPIFSDNTFLRFKWLSTLSDASDAEVTAGLDRFINAYGSWIDTQHDDDHEGIAMQLREGCKKDQQRMQQNVRHLANSKEHLHCFRSMNTAMFMQIWHKMSGAKIRELMDAADFIGFGERFYRDKADDRIYPGLIHAAWRPFQLAFILLNIDGLFKTDDDPAWKARNEWVDLVWFPTGGGKTEAYLGLIALTILHRRLTYGERGGGTAAIMRYTLRLLTAQQFQRATLLIMALELMRRWNPEKLGVEPIYIGLYVGEGSLPNKLKGDEDSLEAEYVKLAEAQQKGYSNISSKILVRECPWCKRKLDPVNYEPVNEPNEPFMHARILLSCSDDTQRCAFYFSPLALKDLLVPERYQGPIPVSLCDEEIYQHPPALLFGTVDKFAQIAHKVSCLPDKRNADSRRLFGTGNWERGKSPQGYLTPDLIIQDELHLMMGPLGSAVALFESAIDQLCSRLQDGIEVRPKVISSTATTRNTDLQIMALFDRKVNLFPKTGIHCDDSFFATYKRASTTNRSQDAFYLSNRRYIGILPTGRTQMWMQLRLAAILFTHRAIFESQQLASSSSIDGQYGDELSKAMDYYHTVLAYYNSLREVGKTESQIYTYLLKETRRVFNRSLRKGKLMHCFYTYESSFHNGELTGRLSGEEVIQQMRKAEMKWSARDRLAHTQPDSGHIQRGKTPPDLVIATNMISVGIDISRFNTMIMNCMPRNIAEYIQATSRVARDDKGLVITVHHPFRSRDLSHYQHFIEFHEKMYSYVEPISITPFTRKALARYLPLYIATMIRHVSGFTDRRQANVFLTEQQRSTIIERLMTYFRSRSGRMADEPSIERVIKELLTDDSVRDIQSLVEEALQAWTDEFQKAADQTEELVFNHRSSKATPKQRQLYVDIDEFEENIHAEIWRVPQSLRVVDPEAIIHINPK